MTKIGDYNKIMSDRNIFNQIVYTPLSEALKLLEERRRDTDLMAKIEKLLDGDVPEILKQKKCAVLGRHIATPNHESRMFISIAKENNLEPLFFEYHEDKFTSNNDYKHSLGQLQIQNTDSNQDNEKYENITIVDFNKHNGKKIKEVTTMWGQKLLDFHKQLFEVHGFKKEDYHRYDASPWFKTHGGNANNYYTKLLLLFTCYGILFENFLTSLDSEGDFTKNIVLPSLEEVINITGVKPLIIPLGPLDMEKDGIWFRHLSKVKKIIPKF